MEPTDLTKAPELNYVNQRLKNQFKRVSDDDGPESCFSKVCKIWEIPLNFFRDYTIPMAEEGDWDRTRASILPLTVPISFCFLFSLLEGE